MDTMENVEQPLNMLSAILSDESFNPAEPNTLADTGLSESLVDSLLCKYLSVVGTCSGRNIADHLALPYGVLEDLFHRLRARQFISHTGSAPLNDYYYTLTDQGRQRAQTYIEACGYIGPAPVPLIDYVLSVEAQTIRAEAPRRAELERAFKDISIDPEVFDSLGPAVNSGAGLFLYGAPGNGKTTLAERITRCFGQHVWIPRTLVEDGQLIKLYDPAYHEAVQETGQSFLKQNNHDKRWIKVRRPTVVAGGELTMDSLEIRHDPRSNVSEAPLQLKSNCGSLLIDDFGRQRMEPEELLNRWIVPLEKRYDFLTLASGKKIQVPFEQLILFSTNLDPNDLVDEAFLRRIPYKVNIGDPSEAEFHRLLERCAVSMKCEYRREAVEHLLATHYRPVNRRMRRCHPRDLLVQVRNFCAYNDLPLEMTNAYFDRVVKSYFTSVLDCQENGPAPVSPPVPAMVQSPQTARTANILTPGLVPASFPSLRTTGSPTAVPGPLAPSIAPGASLRATGPTMQISALPGGASGAVEAPGLFRSISKTEAGPAGLPASAGQPSQEPSSPAIAPLPLAVRGDGATQPMQH